MARVPDASTPSVIPSGVGTPEQSLAPTSAQMGGGFGEGLKSIGQAGFQAASALADTALRFQQMRNQAEGDDLNTKFINGMIGLAHGPNGYYTKQGKDAVDAYPKFQEDMNDLRVSISDSASNPMTRLEFDSNSRRMFGYQMLDAAQHRDQQQLKWADSADRGAMASTINDAVANYNDPNRIALAEKTIVDRYAAMGHRNGTAPEEDQANIQKEVGSLYKDLFFRKFADDPLAAQRFFYNQPEKFGPYQDEIVKTFKGPMKQAEYWNLADGIMSGTTMSPKPETLAGALRGQERTGSGVVSFKGAGGVMQMEPAAARQAASELGIPFDWNRVVHDDAYNVQLGTQYTKDLLGKFRGNVVLASAAYNWGAERVNDLIKRVGDPSLGQVSMQAFIAALPNGKDAKGNYNAFNDVQKYVRGVVANLGGLKEGTPATSGDVRDHLESWLNDAKTSVDALYGAGSTEAEEAFAAVGQRIHSQVDLIHAGQEDTSRQAMNGIHNALFGGPQGQSQIIHSFDQLFSIPGMAKTYAQLLPEDQQKVRDMIAKPPHWTQQTEQAYGELKAMAAIDPTSFGRLNIPRQYGTVLPPSVVKELINDQVKAKNSPRPDVSVTSMMQQAEVWGAPSKTTDPEGYQQFAGAMLNESRVFELVHGRKPNSGDIRNLTESLLMQRGTGWGAPMNFQTGYTEAIRKIPDDEIKVIGSAFKRKFGREPSAGEVVWLHDAVRNRGK